MKIMQYGEIPAAAVEMEGAKHATIRWLISKEDGAPHFAMRLFELGEGGHTPLHAHDSEHEVYILHGTGTVFREGEEVPVAAGTFVYVQPGETHRFVNSGKEPLRFLCVVPHAVS